MNIEIKQNSDGLWGGVDKGAGIVIPFEYDEITLFGDKYYCRKKNDYVWIDQNGHTCKNNTWTSEDGSNALLKEKNGVIYKYQNGKYGVLRKDKSVILPCSFDEVQRWEHCDVIETRTGTRYQYFDMNAKPILTKHRNGLVDDMFSPYSIDEQQNDIALMIMEFVDNCYDEQCCVCYGHSTRLDRILRQDVEGMMRSHCEYQRFPADAFHRFNGWDTYIYRAYIAHGKSDNPMGDCIRQLHEMRCYSSSWFYLDKVLTNENTHLTEQELELLQYAANDCGESQQTTIGYGIDNTLADGEAKILHIEYYADHWPSDEEYTEEPPLGCLINCIKPDRYDWEKTKSILEAHQDLSTFGLISEIVDSLWLASDENEMHYYYNAIAWGLKHGWNPNEPTLGRTAIECIDEDIRSFEKEGNEMIDILNKIKELLQQYGGVTLAEHRSKNPFYRSADFLVFGE